MSSVSYSETSTYLQCHRKWEYGYGRSLQRVSESHALALGSAIHKILQSFYDTILSIGGDSQKDQKDAFVEALTAAHIEYESLVAEGYEDSDNRAALEELMFDYYFPNEPLVKNGWQILAVEKEFALDTVYEEGEDAIRTPFVIDVIAYDPNGKIVVIDHKGLYDFFSYEQANLAPQIPLYIGGLRALGYRVDYGMYNMLRTRKVSGPKMKKAELLEAVNKAIEKAGGFPDSDFDIPTSKMKVDELQMIADEHKIETSQPADITQKLQTLDMNPNSTRVKRTFLEQLDTAQEILALKSLTEDQRDIKMHRVANRMVCQSCSFYDLCQTELVGGNVDLVIRTDFKIRERKTFDVESEEYVA